MKTQVKQRESVSHVIQSKTRAGRQAPTEQILQSYSIESGKGKGESLQQQENSLSPFTSHPSPEKSLSPNKTGLPDKLKTGIENLSGYSMDDVKVHYNSPKPAQLQALAYTQGTDIHVAPGQEKHLPHEAWHVVQQMQGRVQPTMQLQGVNVNDNEGLEKEADVMGGKYQLSNSLQSPAHLIFFNKSTSSILQRKLGFEYEIGSIKIQRWNLFTGWYNPPKGIVISNRNGYSITTDEYQDQADLEIIINPINEENQEERNNLITNVIPDITNVLTSIINTSNGDWVKANDIPALNGWKWNRFLAEYNLAGTLGQLQMTGGISMNRLFNFISGQLGTNYVATLNNHDLEESITIVVLTDYVENPIATESLGQINAINHFDGLALPLKQQLAAIIALITRIPYALYTNMNVAPYPKGAAGNFLARTDFSKLMMLLPNEVKELITPERITTLVLATINHLLADADDIPDLNEESRVIPIGYLFSGQDLGYDLTIHDWIHAITPTNVGIQGQDLLTKNHYPGTAQQKTWLESLGGYGNKVDEENKPIFEFRTLDPHKIIKVNNLAIQIQKLINYFNFNQ
ncbi:MAG: DUF4157 domain-containing protein [Bacteroidales bacterium]|jgi:hypothetical protein|nr:DUF4157 domain-containing protein [Bacteroidales bacterium]